MKWSLIVMIWANVLHPLPEEDWAGRAYSKWIKTFDTYDDCMTAKDKVVASLTAPERSTIACLPGQ